MSISASPMVADRVIDPVRLRQYDRVFYTGMSILMLAIVFVGFSPTFYSRAPGAQPELYSLSIVHGIVFSCWMVLFAVQTSLVAARRTAVHRRLGVLGACLAAVVVALGIAMGVTAAKLGNGPPGVDPKAFVATPLFDMLVLGPLFAAAIYCRRVPEMHKRLMLIGTISMIGAALARMSLGRLYGPLFFFGVTDLLLLMGVVFDKVTRGQVHKAYIVGGLALVISQPLRLIVGRSDAWHRFVDVLIGM